MDENLFFFGRETVSDIHAVLSLSLRSTFWRFLPPLLGHSGVGVANRVWNFLRVNKACTLAVGESLSLPPPHSFVTFSGAKSGLIFKIEKQKTQLLVPNSFSIPTMRKKRRQWRKTATDSRGNAFGQRCYPKQWALSFFPYLLLSPVA